jgi:hypothetical protein
MKEEEEKKEEEGLEKKEKKKEKDKVGIIKAASLMSAIRQNFIKSTGSSGSGSYVASLLR